MKTLKEAYEKIKEIYPEVVDVSSDDIKQPGVYLLLNGVSKLDWQVDLVSFKIYVAARSMMSDNLGVISLLDELRLKAIKEAINLKDDPISEISFLGFKESLYIYSFEIGLKIYRSKEN